MEHNPPHDNQQEPEIELQEPEASCGHQGTQARLPVIFFAEEVTAGMRRHAGSDTSREIAGVLVGEVNYERNTVIVHACIPAEFTEASRGNVTFTHDTWTQVNSVMDSKYADYTIVGWYHSHPNFGVFLSSYDTFIHRNFFSARWQIAYVIDPVRGDEGCFVWEGEELVRTPDMKLYMDMDAYQQTQAEAAGENDLSVPFTAAADQKNRSPRLETGEKWALGLVAALIAMTLMLQTYGVGEILRLRTELAEARSELSALRIQVTDAVVTATPDLAAPAAPGVHMDAADTDETEVLLCDRHEVMPGDTLDRISRQFYGTTDKAALIAEVNQIRQNTQLQAGTTLLIPRLSDLERQLDPTPEHER